MDNGHARAWLRPWVGNQGTFGGRRTKRRGVRKPPVGPTDELSHVNLMSEMDYGGDTTLVPLGYSINMAPNKTRAKKRGQPKGNKGSPSVDHGVPRSIGTFKCTRLHFSGNLSPVVTDYGYWLGASLSFVPNVTEFTNLFQEYRITWCNWEVTYIPASTERYSTVVWYARDVNDTSGPATIDDASQMSGVKRFAFGPDKRTFKVGFKPMLPTSTAGGSEQLRASPWITTSVVNNTHRGIGLWFQYFNTTHSLGAQISLTAMMSLEFRGTH